MNGDRPARVQALTVALDRKPDLPEARFRLGSNLYALGRYADALAQFQQANGLDAALAFQRFGQMALASAALHQTAHARDYLDQARAAARTPDQRAALERVAAAVEQGAANPPGIRHAEPDTGRPILRRKQSP